MNVFKQRRRQGQTVAVAKKYSGSYRLPWMLHKSTIALQTTDKGIAEKRLKEYIRVRELEHEGLPIPSHLWGAPTRTIATLVKDYESSLKSQGLNEKHVHDSITRIETISFACKWNTISDVNPAAFEKWRSGAPTNIRTGRPLSVKTLNEYLTSLRAFMNWLKSLGVIEKDPLEFVPKGETRGNEQKKRREWTDGEMEAFMERGKPPQRKDYRLGVWLLRWTGLRKNELTSLRWGDVFLEESIPYLLIRANISKNRKEERVPLMQKVAKKLRELRPAKFKKNQRVLPFTLPGSEQLRADLKRAGVHYRNDFGDLDFHALRYTFGHWLAVQGISLPVIQSILRHVDPSTTAKHYMNVAKLSQNEDVTKLFAKDDCTPICTPEFGAEGLLRSQPDKSPDKPNALQLLEDKLDRLTLALSDALGHKPQNGCPGWDRTSDKVVNSHLLYR